MEKQVVELKIESYIHWDWMSVEIDDMISDLKEVKKSGATHIEFKECDLSPIIKREETDKEFEARKQLINQHKQNRKTREINQLRELQLKYPTVK